LPTAGRSHLRAEDSDPLRNDGQAGADVIGLHSLERACAVEVDRHNAVRGRGQRQLAPEKVLTRVVQEARAFRRIGGEPIQLLHRFSQVVESLGRQPGDERDHVLDLLARRAVRGSDSTGRFAGRGIARLLQEDADAAVEDAHTLGLENESLQGLGNAVPIFVRVLGVDREVERRHLERVRCERDGRYQALRRQVAPRARQERGVEIRSQIQRDGQLGERR
jgi:hypothetical protein